MNATGVSVFAALRNNTKEVFRQFLGDGPFELAAALSFYTLLSLAPLLLLLVSLAGLIWGEDAARGQVYSQVEGVVGAQGAEVIQTVLAKMRKWDANLLALLVSLVFVLVGATTVFGELQSALNRIWDVRSSPTRGTVWRLLRPRLQGLAMVAVMGLLILGLLVLSAVIAGLREYAGESVGKHFWRGLDIAVSLSVMTLLIAAVYKILPDVRIRWRDVWFGAFITAVLMTIGKVLIGWYLGQASVGSPYGAAGSLVVLLVWIYYTSLILFFGAEITQVYAYAVGSPITPSRGAVPIADSAAEPA